MRPKTHLEDDVARYWELQIKYRTESEVEAIRNEMSSWWLSLIETRTLEILTGLGYVKDALPYNYLDKPPASLKAVENNKSNTKHINHIFFIFHSKHYFFNIYIFA